MSIFRVAHDISQCTVGRAVWNGRTDSKKKKNQFMLQSTRIPFPPSLIQDSAFDFISPPPTLHLLPGCTHVASAKAHRQRDTRDPFFLLWRPWDLTLNNLPGGELGCIVERKREREREREKRETDRDREKWIILPKGKEREKRAIWFFLPPYIPLSVTLVAQNGCTSATKPRRCL